MMKILFVALLGIALCQAEPASSEEASIDSEPDFDISGRIEELKARATENLDKINAMTKKSMNRISENYHKMAADSAWSQKIIDEQIMEGATRLSETLDELSAKAQELYGNLIKQTFGGEDLPPLEDIPSEPENNA